jgi:hypothetical protein
VVELSSLQGAFRSGEPIGLNVGVRNVGDHECGPPPSPTLVISTAAGTPLELRSVDLPVAPGAHWVPSETVRQLVRWTPPRAGGYRFQLDVGGVRSAPLALSVE